MSKTRFYIKLTLWAGCLLFSYFLLINLLLYIAVPRGNLSLSRFALNFGASVNQRDLGSETPLMVAAANYQSDMVLLLLSKGANPNLRARTGRTALAFAVGMGDIKSTERLLQAGAQVDCCTRALGYTPLMDAVVDGKYEIAKQLIKYGANVNASTSAGETPLSYALNDSKDVNVIRLLVEAGARPNNKFLQEKLTLITKQAGY